MAHRLVRETVSEGVTPQPPPVFRADPEQAKPKRKVRIMKQLYWLCLFLTLLASCTGEAPERSDSHAAPLLDAGLIHHWTLDGDGLDSVGAQHGTIVGATAVPGQVGDALDFDGSDYVDLGTFADTAATLSVTAWVNQTAWVGGSGDGRIIAVSTSTSEQDHQLMLSAINLQQQCRMRAGGSTFTLKGGSALLGVWQHVACTYDGSTVRLYVDGVEVADRSWSGSVTLNMPGALGRNPSGGRNLNGLVDDVRIYSRALGASEIGELMAWQPVEPGPLDAGTPDSGTDAGLDSGTDSGADSGADSGTGGSMGIGGSAGEGGSCGTAGGGAGGATGGTGGEPVGGSGGEPTGGTGEPDAGVGGSGGETGGMGGLPVDAGAGGSGGATESPTCTNEVTVAMVADIGHPGDNTGSRAEETYALIAAVANFSDRLVLMIVGDLGYEETDPPDFVGLATSYLPGVPIIVARGNHENAADWALYSPLLAEHNLKFPWINCTGIHGEDELCEVDGVSIALSNVDDTNDHFRINDLYQRLLTRTPGNWVVCGWHHNLFNFTNGNKFDFVPEAAYEVCRDAGGFIVNAHDHSYTRSCTVTDFFNPLLTADCANELRVGNGETFVAVNGRGGRNMSATGAGREARGWIDSYITTSGSMKNGITGPGNSDPGALFVTFGGSQPVDEARAVYLDSKLREMDRFTIRRAQ